MVNSHLTRTGYLWLSLCIFSLLINTHYPIRLIAIAGLIPTSYYLAINYHKPHLSVWGFNKNILLVIIGIALFTAALCFWYRTSIGMIPLPYTVKMFVVLSCTIGITEEIIFRGIIQGEASLWHSKGSILIGSAAHASYKSSLFILPLKTIDYPLFQLALLTFLFGLILGYSRYRFHSLWPAIIGHGIFDFLVYAEQPAPLWWVW